MQNRSASTKRIPFQLDFLLPSFCLFGFPPGCFNAQVDRISERRLAIREQIIAVDEIFNRKVRGN